MRCTQKWVKMLSKELSSWTFFHSHLSTSSGLWSDNRPRQIMHSLCFNQIQLLQCEPSALPLSFFFFSEASALWSVCRNNIRKRPLNDRHHISVTAAASIDGCLRKCWWFFKSARLRLAIRRWWVHSCIFAIKAHKNFFPYFSSSLLPFHFLPLHLLYWYMIFEPFHYFASRYNRYILNCIAD